MISEWVVFYCFFEEACQIDIPLFLVLDVHFYHDCCGQVKNGLFSSHFDVDNIEWIPRSPKTFILLDVCMKKRVLFLTK